MNFDSQTLRSALGMFPTGVCVITANPDGYEPLGITVNSFASVSLDPALVLWSLRNDSECLASFEAAQGFAVNVLAEDQMALSNQYSKKDDHQLSKDHYGIGKSGLPVLHGALASFECDMWQRYDGGDHLILVGKVTELGLNATDKPLVFQGGGYRELR